MLTRNVWQAKGLYNGAIGTVRGLLFNENIRPPSQPICVLVEFDKYCGPAMTLQNRDLVPIVPETVAFDPRCGKSGSRRQLPLVIGWAVTIHKSQGLTLKRAILGLGSREFASGISYVGSSRVRSYRDLAFDKSFVWARLESINEARGVQAIRMEIERLTSLINN